MTSYTTGIDFSHWDGLVDWDTTKSAGVQFAFCKATEGNAFLDNQFTRNREEAQRVNIPMGAYHYYTPAIDPIAQALWFTEVAPTCYGLPHVLDLESTTRVPANLRSRIQTFLREVTTITGQRPIIYTSFGFWSKYMGATDTLWALDYPLWIANYRDNAGPLIPRPWHPMQWAFWQYTARGQGHAYGSQKIAVDLNLGAPGILDQLTAPESHKRKG